MSGEDECIEQTIKFLCACATYYSSDIMYTARIIENKE